MIFDCGFFCSQEFRVPSNQSWGWPGEAGTYRIADLAGVGCETGDGQVGVPDHGYSVLRSTGASATDIVWDDYNADNSVIAKGVGIDLIPFGSDHCGFPENSASHTCPHCVLPHGLYALLRRWFRAADRNHDGFISQREAREVIAADFRHMDVNHDGVLSLKDIRIDLRRIGRPPRVKQDLAYYFPFHKGRGGSIHLAEFQRAMFAHVRGMDANHDGRYSWREIRTFYAQQLG